MSEVSVLLKMLDQESLSSSTEEKKTSVWNLVQQIQPPGEDVWLNEDWTSRSFKVFQVFSLLVFQRQCPTAGELL